MHEAFYYHALAVATGGNYHALRTYRERFNTWQAAFKEAHEGNEINPEKEWQRLEHLGITLSIETQEGYPKLLREIPHPPFGIYVRGVITENKPFCAIVGTRKATEEGRMAARRLAHELSCKGLTIVSGLALGIDIEAHRGALDARGVTVAVLAHGLDRIYPRSHERTGQEILERGGAILSEYPPGIPSLPHRFLERNRIVSGLSRGVLIIEAPRISGALATARFALEQNREVLVLPGPAGHPHFAGSHTLIRNGATLVTSTEEILESLGMETKAPQKFSGTATEEESTVLDALTRTPAPLSIDKLIELTNLKANVVNHIVSLLVLENRIEEQEDGFALIQ